MQYLIKTVLYFINTTRKTSKFVIAFNYQWIYMILRVYKALCCIAYNKYINKEAVPLDLICWYQSGYCI